MILNFKGLIMEIRTRVDDIDNDHYNCEEYNMKRSFLGVLFYITIQFPEFVY